MWANKAASGFYDVATGVRARRAARAREKESRARIVERHGTKGSEAGGVEGGIVDYRGEVELPAIVTCRLWTFP